MQSAFLDVFSAERRTDIRVVPAAGALKILYVVYDNAQNGGTEITAVESSVHQRDAILLPGPFLHGNEDLAGLLLAGRQFDYVLILPIT